MIARYMKFCLVAAVCVTLAACGTGGEDEPTSDQPTKDDVRNLGGKSDHIDWCEQLGWYGDGICDDFCAEPDPDCEEEIDCTVAFVVPHCEDGSVLVDELTCEAAGSQCTTGELCGVVSHCLFVGEFCPQVVGTPAECPADFDEVDTCQTSDCEIARGSGDKCTDIAFCEPNFCLTAIVLPQCEAGEALVSAVDCQVAGAECEARSLCGVDSHCLQVGEICPQVVGTPASCPSGTVEVPTCSDPFNCQLARGTGDQCTDFTFCEPIAVCLAFPTCQPGTIHVSSDECAALGSLCETVSMCGQTVSCVEPPQFCPQVVGNPPACPAGTTETPECDTLSLDAGACELVWGDGDKCSEFKYCAL